MKKIMFNDDFCLTQAVLDGRKKMTRRIISEMIRKSPFSSTGREYVHSGKTFKPKYKVGEVVAIAESYKNVMSEKQFGEVWAIGNDITKEMAGYNNKMFVKANLMPHQIKITNIRIERLQDVSEKDCLLEGIHKGKVGNENHWMDAYYTHKSSIEPHCKPREAFAALIDKLNGKGTWESNPQTCVYEFELIK